MKGNLTLRCLLAELEKQFLKDEDGSGRAEDDEGLTPEQAEDGSC